MSSMLETLRQKARLAPEGPGIYMHFGKGRVVLYVGKARNLRNRLKTYFYGFERLPYRTRQLVARIIDFEVVLVQNENESLILESQFVKSHKPPFNVLLRDDKAYPYVRIDTKENWPRVRMVRHRKEDGARYFGPFANGGQMASLLTVIRRYFPLVKCTPHVFKTIPRPCNYYHMKQCLAPCHLEVSRPEYERHLDSVLALLRGDVDAVRKKLLGLMEQAATSTDYERAATYRDQIKAIDELRLGQGVDLEWPLNVDLIGVFWGHDQFAVHVSGLRQGRLVVSHASCSRYSLDVPAFENEGVEHHQSALRRDSLFGLLRQFYLENNAVDHVTVFDPEGHWTEAQTQELASYLKQVAGEGDVRVSCGLEALRQALKPSFQGKELRTALKRLSEAVLENARQRYQDKKEVSDKAEQMLLGLQTFLGLETPPSWIECFDISTFQGTETVASQVVFLEAKPAKSRYRKYVIRSVQGQDDFGSMREVMRRRFRDASGTDVPDLLLVDGGEPQVREVKRVLDGMNLQNVVLVGLAKSRTKRSFVSQNVTQSSERIVIPRLRSESEGGNEYIYETRTLRVGSPEFRLVTQLRDEAHRFAISFHRKRRSKRSARSHFDGIPGLGPKRKARVLELFPTPQLLLEHTPQDLVQKAGLSEALASKVFDCVRKSMEESAVSSR